MAPTMATRSGLDSAIVEFKTHLSHIPAGLVVVVGTNVIMVWGGYTALLPHDNVLHNITKLIDEAEIIVGYATM